MKDELATENKPNGKLMMPKAEAGRRLGEARVIENRRLFPKPKIEENATKNFPIMVIAQRKSHHEKIKFPIALVDSPPYTPSSSQQRKTSLDSRPYSRTLLTT